MLKVPTKKPQIKIDSLAKVLQGTGKLPEKWIKYRLLQNTV